MNDATTEPTQICAWWDRWPDANVALALPDDVMVLDLDRHGRDDGVANFYALVPADEDNPMTVEQVTGNDGRQLFFRIPSGWKVTNSGSVLAPGIDTKSGGGYVIVPPSTTKATYQWLRAPCNVELAAMPEWLLARLAAVGIAKEVATQTYFGVCVSYLRRKFGTTRIPDGRRTETVCKKLAGLLRAFGLTGAQIVVELELVNDQLCVPPMDAAKLRTLGEWIDAKWPPGTLRLDNRAIAGQRVAALRALAAEADWSGVEIIVRRYGVNQGSRRKGVRRQTAQAVLFALLDLAQQLGTTNGLRVSRRRLTTRTPFSRPTINDSVQVLRNLGWLKPVGHWHAGRAAIFDLTLPKHPRVIQLVGMPTPPSGRGTGQPMAASPPGTAVFPDPYCSVTGFLASGRGGHLTDELAADCWRRNQYGDTGWIVWIALGLRSFSTASELARAIRRPMGTVRRKLRRFEADGLAERGPWRRGPAQLLKTYTKREIATVVHKAERILHHARITEIDVETPRLTSEDVVILRRRFPMLSKRLAEKGLLPVQPDAQTARRAPLRLRELDIAAQVSTPAEARPSQDLPAQPAQAMRQVVPGKLTDAVLAKMLATVARVRQEIDQAETHNSPSPPGRPAAHSVAPKGVARLATGVDEAVGLADWELRTRRYAVERGQYQLRPTPARPLAELPERVRAKMLATAERVRRSLAS